MTDSDILDQLVQLLKLHDEGIVVGGNNPLEDRVYIRAIRPILASRERKGWKRIFK
jgi:hypothetical protein